MGIISRLGLRSFRNYSHLDLNLSEGVTLFIGRNGQGKTNILEAISYLGMLRSFRGHRPASLRQWGTEGFVVGATLLPPLREDSAGTGPAQLPDLPTTLRAGYGERRTLSINGTRVSKASSFINQFLCVPLAPEDIDLVKGTARGRRKFLDMTLTQTAPGYLQRLQDYLEALRCRNAMLRDPHRYPRTALAAYEEQLVAHGAEVEWARFTFVRELCTRISLLSDELVGDRKRLGLAYHSSCMSKEDPDGVGAIVEAFSEGLHRCRERDRREGHTTLGPHRADILYTIGGRSLNTYGSEGECRLMSLFLRLGSLRIIRTAEWSSRGIVLLVDDVMGELDPVRRRAFLQILGDADQVFVAATQMSDDLCALASVVYTVERGTVAPA